MQERKLGIKGSPTREVYFDGVRARADRLLGVEGEGMSLAMRTLNHTRITIATQAVGRAQGVLDLAPWPRPPTNPSITSLSLPSSAVRTRCGLGRERCSGRAGCRRRTPARSGVRLRCGLAPQLVLRPCRLPASSCRTRLVRKPPAPQPRPGRGPQLRRAASSGVAARSRALCSWLGHPHGLRTAVQRSRHTCLNGMLFPGCGCSRQARADDCQIDHPNSRSSQPAPTSPLVLRLAEHCSGAVKTA